MVFYLKVNRLIDYTIRNLQVWVSIIAEFKDAYAYILCDNEKLADRVNEEVDFKGISWSFLESRRDIEYLDLVKVISVAKWHNAAYAHLTPFIHAKEQGYHEYWNIDADDTLFCAATNRVAEMIEGATLYAKNHDIDLFSLDMWRSRSYSMHWSFGITYTNGNVDWLHVMKRHMSCVNGSKYFMNGNHAKNIDEYFTYIKSVDQDVHIETFYFENLLFVHYSDDFIMNPIVSGVFKWKKGKLEYPVIKHIYGIDSLGEIEIAKDVIRMDIGLEDYEGGWMLAQIAPFSLEATNIIEADEYLEYREKLMHKQIQDNVDKYAAMIKMYEDIYIFGFGKFTDFLIDALREHSIFPEAILDNAEFKWGGPINGLNVCNPEIIKTKSLSNVIVLIDVRHCKAIKEQLISFGIPESNIIVAVDYT